MRTTVAVAAVLACALGLVGCAHRKPPECPYRGLAAGDCPSHSEEPLDSLPALQGLSKEGRVAFKSLLEAQHFTTDTVARSMSPAPEVKAWRVLFKEKDGQAAFRCLAYCTRPPRPGKLFGLCGLWFIDRGAFDDEVHALWSDYPHATIPTFFYCLVDDNTPLEEVLPEIEDGKFPRMFRGDE